MAQTVSNVSAGKPAIGGAVSIAPLGTAVPTDATTALANTYKGLGYISEDGLVNSNSPETEQVKAWGGDVVLTSMTEKVDNFQFTLLEVLNPDVLGFIYGESNVSGTLAAGISVNAKAEQDPGHVMVFDMIMRGGVLQRIVIPHAEISEIGDLEYTDSGAAGYQVTITCFPDADGATHHTYIKKPGAQNGAGNA